MVKINFLVFTDVYISYYNYVKCVGIHLGTAPSLSRNTVTDDYVESVFPIDQGMTITMVQYVITYICIFIKNYTFAYSLCIYVATHLATYVHTYMPKFTPGCSFAI